MFKRHKTQYFSTLTDTLVHYLPTVKPNSEDFIERDKWCGRWYIRVEGENEDTWEKTSMVFSSDNLFTKVVEGVHYEGRWVQPVRNRNRIIVSYKKDAMEVHETYDLQFIGMNTMVFSEHGDAERRNKDAYTCFLDENIHDRYVSSDNEKIDWKLFVDLLINDGLATSFWYVFWCIVLGGVFILIVILSFQEYLQNYVD